MHPTPAEENYLKGIWLLQSSGLNQISTNQLADHMSTKASSATDMVQRMAKKGWLNYRPYQGCSLTDQGHTLAAGVIRRNRLWKVFLHKQLRYRWDELQGMAETLEHVADPKLADRLSKLLDHPKTDPHGLMIPTSAGDCTDKRKPQVLSKLEPGTIGLLVAVTDTAKELLKYLETSNLILGSRLEVLRVQPYDGTVHLQLAVREVTLSAKVAEHLLVEVLS